MRDALLGEKTPRQTIRNPSTANRYIAAFSRALTIAMKEWGWLDDSPMRKVSKPADGKGRLLQACKTSPNPHLHPIVSLALLLGMRFGEIVGLKWANIDYVNKLVTLEKTKNGDARILPLSPAVEEILKLCRKTDLSHGLIFKPSSPTNRSGVVDIRNAFTKALTRAEIIRLNYSSLIYFRLENRVTLSLRLI